MRAILIMMMLLPLFQIAKGQDYQGSVGFRGGITSGFTYKVVLHDERAFEGILSFRRGGIQLTGLSVNHEPVLFQYSDRIFAYYGIGLHVGYYGRNREDRLFFTPNLGIDGILGMEYRWLKVPITAGIDYKPFIDLFGNTSLDNSLVDFALNVKYTF